ncbi:MAG: HAMP domain-containing histidine kinase [Muribaculum sp.]|nr:HAMP domain-containing histidine kinase [Muribaculum sp.]
MFRKREPYRFGIWRQMAAGLLAVFLAGELILYGGIHTRIIGSREEQIIRELQNVRENTEIYVRQLLMLNDANNDEASYRRIAEDIARELRVTGGMGLSVLDREGGYLAGSLPDETPDEDVRQAVAGNAAFTMTYPDEDTMLVYFSMPVVIEERTIGIIRYRVDTSALFVQGKETETLVCRITVSVFAVVFLLIAFLMSRFLSPVQKLTKITRQVVGDLAGERIDIRMPAQLADSRRRDEIGELSRNFSVMLETIGVQFRNMREDRERIIKLLGSRQEFYNNVTHELKTPLTTIQGYAQLLEDDEGMDGELARRGLHQILTESTRLHRMVIQLLEMSDKSVCMEAKTFDLAQTGRSVAQALEIKANRYEMHIRTTFKETLPVRGVEERLRQVAVNLVDNAVKYGDSHAVIRIFGYRKDGYVLLAVQNSGKGLSEEERQRVFEPFYRVDKSYSREQGSAGLGLSICKKIMDEQGGEIGVKSVPGKRTVFYIRLRAAEDVGKCVHDA